jgi:universal stress protein A
MLIHRVLVPTDLSDDAERAFEYGAELAALYRAPLLLVHVYATPLLYSTEEPILAAPPPDIDDVRATLDSSLQALAARARTLGVPDVSIAVTGGDAWREIVRVAKERDCDLIVMGTHGRTGLSHLVLGSVAEKVVQHASCPVLTIGKRAELRAA